MDAAIIGSGNVGNALADALPRAGGGVDNSRALSYSNCCKATKYPVPYAVQIFRFAPAPASRRRSRCT